MTVDYMIGGSHASMYYGEPRVTRDVDVIVALGRDRLAEFLHHVPADTFYVDADTAAEAIEARAQFTIIHAASGLKIDVYINPDTPYDWTRPARRQRLPLVEGVSAYFARPEDVILYKLLYHRQVESSMHLRDIVGILRLSGSELDLPYLEEWADRLGVRSVWEQLRKHVE
ncbi:MAG: hypothetical protein FJZ38_01020 [Candidatus Rokubacteria bacterium]|nr:hypothetical protein [Candidatus Rokubacteria bacterium]